MLTFIVSLLGLAALYFILCTALFIQRRHEAHDVTDDDRMRW